MTTSRLPDLGDERYVALTTFRRSGEPVTTPVWVAREEDGLVVVTGLDSGKAKRLRNSSRVLLRPCTVRGKPLPGSHEQEASATVHDAAHEQDAISLLRAKYGWQFRVFTLVERAAARGTPRWAVLRVTVRSG